MAQTELQTDESKPCNFSAINEFYENNLNSIVKLESPSPSSGTHSSNSLERNRKKFKYDDSESSTVASDSENEELELEILPNKRTFEKATSIPSAENVGHIIVVASNSNKENVSQSNGLQFGTVAIENSTDIQFGNKTFYNGPVTIKQFMLDDQHKKWKLHSDNTLIRTENGISNRSFDGDTHDVTSDQICGDSPGNNKSDVISENREPYRIKSLILNRKNLFFVGFAFLLALALIILVAVFTSFRRSIESERKLGDGDDSRKNIPISSTIGKDLLPGTIFRLISRDEWLAQRPEHELTNLALPVPRVIITHTASETCDTQAACVFRVRTIQTFHIESRSWDDIAYNFLIGGDGNVYEGRGWDKQGAHTKGFNTGSIGIAFIGTFNKIVPSDREISAFDALMKQGVELGKLTPDYGIYAHRQLAPFESPGAAFFEIIKTWGHWRNETNV